MSFIITQISQAVKNSERANIYLNGKFWLGINKNKLLSFKLMKGKELTELEKHEIESATLNNNLIERAVNYARIRPRSCSEVKDYLIYKRKVEPSEAENVIDYLQNEGILSDEKFAKWFVEYKLSSGTSGINKLKTALLQKRISKEIINSTLNEIFEDESFKKEQSIKLEELAEKLSKTIKYKDAYDFKSKLVQKLMGKGFKYDEIKEVLKRIHLPS